MPSQSYKIFVSESLQDVHSLIEAHEKMGGSEKGKKALAHITRSAILLLCAAWEMYVEDVLLECVDKFNEKIDSPVNLPLGAKKFICKEVEDLRKTNEVAALGLAQDGWKKIYREGAEKATQSLNTPKSGPIDNLFEKLIGMSQLSNNWSVTSHRIDRFVATRGEIAHKGVQAGYITKQEVEGWLILIRNTATETDKSLLGYLRSAIPINNSIPKKQQQIWQLQYAFEASDLKETPKVLKKLDAQDKFS